MIDPMDKTVMMYGAEEEEWVSGREEDWLNVWIGMRNGLMISGVFWVVVVVLFLYL